MAIVGDIPASFFLNNHDHDFTITISIRGKDNTDKLELINSIVFEIPEGKYTFSGLPIENNSFLTRTIFAKKLHSSL
jgi:hypothetical protein